MNLQEILIPYLGEEFFSCGSKFTAADKMESMKSMDALLHGKWEAILQDMLKVCRVEHGRSITTISVELGKDLTPTSKRTYRNMWRREIARKVRGQVASHLTCNEEDGGSNRVQVHYM